MFGRRIYENSRPGGIGLLQVIDEREGEKEERLFVPLKRSELHGEVTGPLAALRLVQVYEYTREQCERVLEAAYRFPLPGDAAVTQVCVRFGEVEIVTQLKEREQAEDEYKEAVEQGRQAVLLTREAPDVFTLRVAGIQPDQEVRVETSYVQLARPQGDNALWSLRVPLTTAPRYVREDEAGSRHAQGQPLALLRDPGHRFTVDLLVHDAGQITSPTHAIDCSEGASTDNGHRPGAQRVCLRGGEVIPDRDFVLLWAPRQERERAALSVALHQEAQWTYFLAMVAPPATHEAGSGAPREVILLVDHSGSMSGPKWEASDWAVNHFLSGLTEQDQFALGLFHSTTKWFAREPRQATGEHVQAAARYLDENRDSGGTNLGVALEQALGLKRTGRDEQARHVLIVTDAQVSDAGRILRLADQEAGRSRRRRISVLCIDAAPNAFLAHELAERGGGLARFLTSNPDEEDISTALEDVLADWAEPVLVGLRLEIDRSEGQASGREVLKDAPKTIIDLGDLPHGRAVWVAGRIPADPQPAGQVPAGQVPEIVFRLTTRRDTVATARSSLAGEQSALKALFGARRIAGLEYLMHSGYQGEDLKDQLRRLGYDPAQVQIDAGRAVYAENAREDAREALKGLLVRESLAYGLASAETAFVAVRTEAGQRVEGSVVVANALPVGWSDAFLSAPGGGVRMAMAAPSTGAKNISLQAGGPRLGLRRLAGRRRAPAVAASIAAMPQDLQLDGGRPAEVTAKTVFAGVPSFVNGQAVLWEETLLQEATLSRIQVAFAGPAPVALDRGLALWIFVEDLAMPRARIRLADLARLGGQRPLNLRVRAGGVVRVVLVDANGVWETDEVQPPGTFGIEVRIDM